MIAIGVIVYLLGTLGVGVWASRRVKTAEDFLVAGHSLPLFLATATVFATWFGAESVLGTSSKVAQVGMIGAVVDPLGAALCLFLVGILFARPLYRMKLLTFGDFYRNKFGAKAELIASICLILSYLGWLAGQMVALGLLGQLVFGLEKETGIVLGALIVTAYTFTGGMWSIAILDFIQNFVIVAGLILTFGQIGGQIESWETFENKLPEGFFSILPQERSALSWLNYLALWITIGLGSIPQQDVFQRVMASQSEKVATLSVFLGGVLYLTIGLMPVFLAAYIRAYHPELVGLSADHSANLNTDPQVTIPRFILEKVSPFAGLLFIGALISAIFSTASAAMLAPAAIFAENFARRLFPSYGEKNLLLLSRAGVILVSFVSLIMALSRGDIHELVAESSALSLVSLFATLCAGLYLKKTPQWAAIASMVAGTSVWLAAKFYETSLDPLLFGFAASILVLILGWAINVLFLQKTKTV